MANATPPASTSQPSDSLPPPPYHDTTNDSASKAQLDHPPQRPQPANYITIVRDNGHLTGTFVIDPSLPIPTSLLPPLTPGEMETKRNNLNLETKSGSINVDIHIASVAESLPIAPASGDKQTRKGKNKKRRSDSNSNVEPVNVAVHVKGSRYVAVKVHTPAKNAPSCTVKIRSRWGFVWLCLPRSYQGPVNITYGEPPEISNELSRNFTTFSEAGRTRKCFLGDLTRWKEGDGGEVNLEAVVGKVYLQYDDEPEMVNTQDMKDTGCCIA